jgi:hypothetical protein
MKDYTDLKASKIAHGTTKNFRNTLEVFQDFQKDIHLQLAPDTLNKQVFEKILSYLLVNRKYRDSTVRRHLPDNGSIERESAQEVPTKVQ